MRTHSNEKPFVCSECDYKTASKSDLTVHMRTHGNKTPFSCEYCPFKAAIIKYVAMHIKTYHSAGKRDRDPYPSHV